MSEPLALFVVEDGVYRATSVARSRWSPATVGGYAVCALFARELEPYCPEDFTPARFGVEMFHPVPMSGVRVTTTLVREGNRIVVVDASALDGDREVARASATFLRIGEDPPGLIWDRGQTPEPPPTSMHPVTAGPFEPWLGSGERWSESMEVLQDRGRKRMWQNGIPVLEGIAPSGFERAAMIADAASMVTHAGSHGVGFINCNVELALCRLPEPTGVGIEADHQASHGGVSFGVATVYDRLGVIGSAQVSAVANARRQVDLAEVGAYLAGRRDGGPDDPAATP